MLQFTSQEKAYRIPAATHVPSPFPLLLHVNSLPFSARERVEKKLSFLEPVAQYIHSMVIVGSAAYTFQGQDSDIDLVIITTAGGHGKVCEVLFDREIEESLANDGKSEFEWTVLSSTDTEALFQISSPFAYSIRYGAVIRDDGYLLLLRGRRYPLLPQKEYYRTSLFEKILTPYYAALREFHRQTTKRNPAGSQAEIRKWSPAELFAQVIVRMLYVTLPARGMMPLTKNDVVTYARKAYGTDAEELAARVLDLVRNTSTRVRADECLRLKNFAVQLFREILDHVDVDHDVRNMIADAAKMAGKTYDSIQSAALKNCVV